MDSKAVSKADDNLQKMRDEKRLKSTEDRRVSSEVFDKQTLETLYKLAKSNYLDLLHGAISTGKEANVFRGINENDEFVAVKIYRISTSDFKKMQYYIQGDPRFNIKTNNKRQIVYAWVNKEFRNLNRLLEAGIKVPKPFVVKNNILLMEFIGDDEGNPSQPLKNKPPENPKEMLDTLIETMKIMYQEARLVHGDLSVYNILNHNEYPIIIDVSQSVVVDNPISTELLERDIKNILRSFQKYGVKRDYSEVKDYIMGL